jgi:uncharacterized protein (DUF736 family)
MNMQKPTFGSTKTTSSANETKEKREEAGCIWDRKSKAGMDYKSITLELPEEVVKKALVESTNGKIKFDLVAFVNKYKEEGDNKPSFRIYISESRK